MDNRSFRLANQAVGNPEGATALEILLSGPSLRFASDQVVAVAGAPMDISVDGVQCPMYEPITVAAGATLRLGSVAQRGLRTYSPYAEGSVSRLTWTRLQRSPWWFWRSGR